MKKWETGTKLEETGRNARTGRNENRLEETWKKGRNPKKQEETRRNRKIWKEREEMGKNRKKLKETRRKSAESPQKVNG